MKVTLPRSLLKLYQRDVELCTLNKMTRHWSSRFKGEQPGGSSLTYETRWVRALKQKWHGAFFSKEKHRGASELTCLVSARLAFSGPNWETCGAFEWDLGLSQSHGALGWRSTICWGVIVDAPLCFWSSGISLQILKQLVRNLHDEYGAFWAVLDPQKNHCFPPERSICQSLINRKHHILRTQIETVFWGFFAWSSESNLSAYAQPLKK